MKNPPLGLAQTRYLLIQCYLSFHVVPVMVIFGTVDGVLVPLMVRVVPVMVFVAKKWYR